MKDFFNRFSHRIAVSMGSPVAFVLAVLVIVVWSFFGPPTHYSETWQLVINTGTTIITFLMVFVIQNSQNRDTKAVHLKLDELIRALNGARNRLVDLENWTDEELESLQKQFQKVQRRAPEADHTPGPNEEVSDRGDISSNPAPAPPAQP